MVRERHPEKRKAPYRVTRIARKDHKCAWCPRIIEKGAEYYQATMSSRYHLECWEKKRVAQRDSNHNPVRRLAYWFVTEFLKEKWSWNLHKRYLAEAKCYISPKADPITGEAQRSFTVQEITQCLNAMRNGYFGTPILDIRTIHAVVWRNHRTGKTFLEEWLEIPPMPPTYQAMALQDWINQHGDRAVEQEVITARGLEMLKAIAGGR